MTADDRRRRKLSGDDHAIWRIVTRSVVPLKRKRVEPLDDAIEPAAKAAPRQAATQPRPVATTKAPSPKVPPLVPIDRRTKQRVARGQVAIDARLDLHGRTQGEAHAALLRFLHRAQGDGARTVLVITGKGRADEGRGVLKRQVPLWLALPEFRSCVLGIDVAHHAQGGEGALYVRLRRGR
jgi:DNA-nicking Smr family endonuclease